MTDNTTAGQRPEFARATRDPLPPPPEPPPPEPTAPDRLAELEAEAERLDAEWWALQERRHVVARELAKVRAELSGA